MKKCFVCGEVKPLIEFYAHKQMSDGRLNKCKDCTKLQATTKHHENSKNPEWIEKERERHREKYHRLNYKEAQKEWDKDKPWKSLAEYKGLRKKAKRFYYIPDNYELHHWNYNLINDFFAININLHKKIHKVLTLDTDSLCYMCNGELLDSKIKHMLFIYSFCNSNNIEANFSSFILK